MLSLGTESKSFAKETGAGPGEVVTRYSILMPRDSRILGRDIRVALASPVALATVTVW